MLVYAMQAAPTHRIQPKTPKRPIKISPKHFFRFLWTTQSSFTHHKCLVNCDCNDARTTWKQLQSTTDDREIAINMHLFAYAVIRSPNASGIEVVFRSFPLFLSLTIFEFCIRSFFIFSALKCKQCQKMCGVFVHPTQYRIHRRNLFTLRTAVVLCLEACASMPWKIQFWATKHTHTIAHRDDSNARFTYSFSLITSNPFLLCQFSTRKRMCVVRLVLQLNVFALPPFVHAFDVFSHKFSSHFSDCQILYPILAAINDKRYDAAIKPSRLHITVAIKTMILSTTSISVPDSYSRSLFHCLYWNRATFGVCARAFVTRWVRTICSFRTRPRRCVLSAHVHKAHAHAFATREKKKDVVYRFLFWARNRWNVFYEFFSLRKYAQY